MRLSVHLFKYITSAFLYHWNLLAFLGGMGFALLSGFPGILCPLVLAGEAAYLGLLGTHPKFQQYVDAQEHQAARQKGSVSAESTMQRMLNGLPNNLVQRFESLRSRCLELRQLAQEMKDPGRAGLAPPLEDLQLAGLDRLLWIYLRLLFTQNSMEQFMQKTKEDQIQADIHNLENRLKGVADETANPQRQKVRKALEDNLETSRARLANFQKARDNYELVKLEIERLENKIRSLSELAVNRQEPDFISGQVDQVAESMVETERTMGELQFVTGLQTTDEAVPEMLRRQPVTEKQ
jgi:hypothetical protein